MEGKKQKKKQNLRFGNLKARINILQDSIKIDYFIFFIDFIFTLQINF